MREIITHEERVYDGRVIHLALLDVTLPNGSAAKRELVRHPGAVAVVALIGEDVLMVRQFRIAAGQVMLEIPAGTLNPGEDPLLCAERELQEETGYRPGALESLGGIFVAPGYTTEFIHLFLATGLIESRLAMDADEFIEPARMPLRELVAMIERGEIQDGKTITAALKVARRLGI
ncbi:MAG: NUDIX hydrolase [Anaerolineae bacterium]|nr:NUDIX hydrolase [Anaerolineae bacterium]